MTTYSSVVLMRMHLSVYVFREDFSGKAKKNTILVVDTA
jgi:hypothetical protein